jgi:serine/threonine protein kinase
LFQSLLQGTFRKATWRGIPVAVKKLDDDLIADGSKVWVVSTCFWSMLALFYPSIILIVWMPYRQAFRDELDVLQLIRHPNVVQFLGAVTQSNPMMIVMEFMRKVCLKGNINVFKSDDLLVVVADRLGRLIAINHD